MNPWRKRRRQLLRRQNEGSYTERMIRLADLGITVTVGPLTPEQRASRISPPVLITIDSALLRDGYEPALLPDGTLIDFTKPMPRLFIAHDPSEFFEMGAS